ncbi:MAG: hypothetical protein KAT58_05970 [candidate division Zixibacteria bacterium]|nr:hypothetical protein [candidate division Zixibacteria bacterium]
MPVVCTILMLLLTVADCGSRQGNQEEAVFSEACADSILKSLVPKPKHQDKLAVEWLTEQKEIIKRDSLAPELIAEIIEWHRAEVSELARIKGYTTFPLVEKSDFRLDLDSVLSLQITELNRYPRLPVKVFYLPARATGIAFLDNPLQRFSALVTAAGGQFRSPQHFREIVLGFLALACADAQIALTNQIQWQLFYLADSLSRKVSADEPINRLAEGLRRAVAQMPVVDNLETLPQAIAFRRYLDENAPGWEEKVDKMGIIEVNPSFRNGIYRLQIDLLDSFSLRMTKSVFYYEKERGFWVTAAELRPSERVRQWPIDL